MRVTVRGAGVAGLACAVELAERGASVEVLERCATLAGAGCSWFAGGMLAPWCELESGGALIARLGEEGITPDQALEAGMRERAAAFNDAGQRLYVPDGANGGE